MIYDVCVIGAGSGGLTTAAFCASLGSRVVLIEKHKPGGDCLNYGCVPSKALIHASKIGMSFSDTIAHVRSCIATIEPNDSFERFQALGVTTIMGEARFIAKSQVMVNGTVIEARRFVIATGSRAFIPPIDGLTDYLTNETVFDLEELPKNLNIIGGGPIGVELAQSFARLGSRVTLYIDQRILPRDHEQAAKLINQALLNDGVMIEAGVKVNSVKNLKPGLLLLATGRAPNIDLDLEKAGVTYSQKGILVDKGLKTSNRRIYAIGDVIGDEQFTHAAGFHGSLVAQNILFWRPINHTTSAMPRCTYTAPEVASVGETTGLLELHADFSHNDRAITDKKTIGFIKLHVTKRGKIKGATIVGDNAGELITPYTLAINKGLGVGDILGTIMPYPTLSEAGKRAAGEFYKASAKSPIVRAVVSVIRFFR